MFHHHCYFFSLHTNSNSQDLKVSSKDFPSCQFGESFPALVSMEENLVTLVPVKLGAISCGSNNLLKMEIISFVDVRVTGIN